MGYCTIFVLWGRFPHGLFLFKVSNNKCFQFTMVLWSVEVREICATNRYYFNLLIYLFVRHIMSLGIFSEDNKWFSKYLICHRPLRQKKVLNLLISSSRMMVSRQYALPKLLREATGRWIWEYFLLLQQCTVFDCGRMKDCPCIAFNLGEIRIVPMISHRGTRKSNWLQWQCED